MNPFRSFLRFFLVALSFRVVEEGGGGGVPVAPPAPPSDASTVAADAPAATPAVSTPAPAPRTMLDAINDRFDPEKTDLATGQPRDPLGRFAHKNADGSPAPAPAAPVVAAPVAGAPVVPAAPAIKTPPTIAELTQMPEGLAPKSQERFQQLANGIKEREAERDEARNQVAYVRETFQQHGIRQDQFEQAAQILGAMNRGDWQGALQALDEQRRQIALQLGQPVPGVDALSQFPDLRQAVDNLQVTEQHAMEIARARAQQLAGRHQQEQAQRQQQTQQQEQQAVQAATSEVDAFCKQLASTDMDYPVIEAQLLPAIPQLLAGLPPNRWKTAVETQYSLLKRMASTVRGASPAAPAPILRPTGQGSPATAPKTMFDAMWGSSR